jgi:integrase
MAIFKRGKIYWYHFIFNGQHIQESTKQGNPRVARQMEAAHRTSLAKGEVGIREKKPVLTLFQFMTLEFMPWVAATFREKPKTFLWYRGGARRLAEFEPIAAVKLDEINGEKIAAFVAYRQTAGLNTTSINRELQILRRILHLAVEWGRAEKVIKIKMLPGEICRERVLTIEESVRYLAATPEPLLSIATILIDSGLRPEECFRLRWEFVLFHSGPNGKLQVTHGKTRAARRQVPMSPRVRTTLEAAWLKVGKPDEGWVFPSATRSGHVEPSTIRLQHLNALRICGVRPFVLYILRHTFLTRLGASGCDVWSLARLAGHCTIGISARYVHPSDETVLLAMAQMASNLSEPEVPKMLPH